MKKETGWILSLLLLPTMASGFAPSATAAASRFDVIPSQNKNAKPNNSIARTSTLSPRTADAAHNCRHVPTALYRDRSNSKVAAAAIPPAAAAATVLFTSLPAEAAGAVPTALWAYAHYLSILAITACLVAEKIIVKPDMTIDEEDSIVKIDLAYGLMAALLIISGFARASEFGKGGDFYIHDVFFWIKMTVAGVWGGLSIFPSLTFYKRKSARNNGKEVPPLSESLAARLQQVVNAEISAILSIPFLATLMARGVWYWDDLPWQIGAVTAIAATGGSFFLYGRQAWTWTDENDSIDAIVAEKE